MMTYDSFSQYARDHQQQLLDEAARGRLLQAARVSERRNPWRARFAHGLRVLADRLEPQRSARLRLLRALAHGELTVDETLHLLDPST